MFAQNALFHLHQLQNTHVRVCHHVASEGHPILHVIRLGDGSWAFLCGRGHRHDHHEGVSIPLKELVKQDMSLNAISKLEPHDFAERPAADQPWTMGDQLALEIPECIEEHGWFIALVNDDQGGNNFAYTIGMETTLAKPDFIVVGQGTEIMPSMLNELGQRQKAGTEIICGEEIPALLSGRKCTAKAMHCTWYRDYLGYGLWYHGSENFDVYQVFWSDEAGLFPWEEGCAPDVIAAQPDLSQPKQ